MWLKSYFVFRRDLRRWRNEFDDLDRLHRELPADAQETGQANELIAQSNRNYRWRLLILTKYWMDRADAHGVSLPNYADKKCWGNEDYDDDPNESVFLTQHGIDMTRLAVREAQKHRREVVGFWFAVIGGLIGSVTGLISVFKN